MLPLSMIYCEHCYLVIFNDLLLSLYLSIIFSHLIQSKTAAAAAAPPPSLEDLVPTSSNPPCTTCLRGWETPKLGLCIFFFFFEPSVY